MNNFKSNKLTIDLPTNDLDHLTNEKLINIIQKLLNSDIDSFLKSTQITQKSALNLLTLVSCSYEQPTHKEIDLLFKLVHLISALQPRFSTPNRNNCFGPNFYSNSEKISPISTIASTSINNYDSAYPYTSTKDSKLTKSETNYLPSSTPPPKPSTNKKIKLFKKEDDEEQDIKIIIATKKGYKWKTSLEVNQLTQGASRNYYHLTGTTNKELLEIIQDTNPYIEVILIKFKILILQNPVNNEQASKIINYFYENYIEIFNEKIFVRKTSSKKLCSIIVYTSEQDVYNQIKNQKWQIIIDEEKFQFAQKTPYNICNKCRIAYSGGHLKCFDQ